MKSFRRGLLGWAVLCGLAWPAHAVEPAKLLAAQSDVAFVTKQMGVPVDGHFKRFDAKVVLDPKHPESGHIVVSIDMLSASLGVPESDGEMPKPIWFNAAKFPQATFESTAIKSAGNGKFDVSGKLSIKGTVREVVVPVQFTQSGGTSTATGAFTIKRLDYKIGEEEWADTTVVANDVKVNFKLLFSGIGAL